MTKDIDTYIERQNNFLDAELESIKDIKLSHHSSWDNHILTLSMAAIGFSFSFLPLKDTEFFTLFSISIILFLLSLIFALLGYIYADSGIKYAVEYNNQRRLLIDQVRLRFYKMLEELSSLEPNTSDYREQDKLIRDSCWADATGLLDNINEHPLRNKLNKTDNRIISLNHAKTWTFILGVIFVVVYSFVNIHNFGL